ncbi:MAG: Uma2 family endonuclease [Bacteroidetes bacterium]|nr:Uma2 family endonuclease [Bacteroidota bacterium]
MGLAQKHLPYYTYDDYYQWEGNWELIYGVPYAMSPTPVRKHQEINGKILIQLSQKLENCPKCKAVMPLDWIISDDTIVQPDVSVICGKFTDDFLKFPPSLIFEILSPKTKDKDRGIKYEIYQSQGVKYYVIVDKDEEQVEVFELKNKKYSKVLETKNEYFTFELKDCKFDFDFRKVW